ncbi:MAG: tetratricopeptide repeat protein, partial [Cyanobacteria bacterium P01_D01_bin.128]
GRSQMRRTTRWLALAMAIGIPLAHSPEAFGRRQSLSQSISSPVSRTTQSGQTERQPTLAAAIANPEAVNLNDSLWPGDLLKTPRLLSSGHRKLEPQSVAPSSLKSSEMAQADSRRAEANRLIQSGLQQYQSSQFQAAIASWEQALALYRDIGHRAGESLALNNLGVVYNALSQYRQAADLYEQNLVIVREINDQFGEASTLLSLGLSYHELGQINQGISFYEQALTLSREIGARNLEGIAIGNLGYAYFSLGQFEQALEFCEQHLTIARELGNRAEESRALGNLGGIYQGLSEYERAVDFYQQFLALARESNDRVLEGRALNSLGIVYQNLGQIERAADFYQQYLDIARETGYRLGEGYALSNLGEVYRQLGNLNRAIDFYEQALAIFRDIGARAAEGSAVGNLALTYHSLGQLEQAIRFYQQNLAIARDVGDRREEGRSLGNLGIVYLSLGEYEQASKTYQQAIAIFRDMGARSEEGLFLSNLGKLFLIQDRSELAILFLKASVTVRESIRGDISGLDITLQQSYTDTIANDYRLLADLLLNQGRIPEAQQVLDLLKLEELREFTSTRAIWTSEGLRLTAPEQAVADAHRSLLALGNTLIQCERTDCDRLDTLYSQQESLLAQYDQEVDRFREIVQANRSEDDIFQNPDNISGEAQELLEAYAAEGQNAVLIYPFVLPDKLWLVWVTVGDVVGSIEVPVSQGELASTIQRLGEHLQSPGSGNLEELQATSQTLYDWLIDPLAAELTQNDIDHLVFVSDRVTRYIPMGVLYDGEQYVLENFTVSTVLTPKATDMDERLSSVSDSPVLGLGLTQAVAGFEPLPAVRRELTAIVQAGNAAVGVYPGQVFLDHEFTLEAMRRHVRNHRVLHMATHAEFVPGRADESYLLLGNGDRLRISDIEVMQRQLRNLHLVVLSACQTALGGPNQDGTEIAGLSSYFLEEGRAEAVIASLWSVNDTSTSLLMQRFYAILSTGEFTKAEALQQAQISILYGENLDGLEARLGNRGRGIAVQSRVDPQTASETSEIGYGHPFHWAPFILIGNGL